MYLLGGTVGVWGAVAVGVGGRFGGRFRVRVRIRARARARIRARIRVRVRVWAVYSSTMRRVASS